MNNLPPARLVWVCGNEDCSMALIEPDRHHLQCESCGAVYRSPGWGDTAEQITDSGDFEWL